jgi:multidrug transporter EmrE-like cation transporter
MLLATILSLASAGLHAGWNLRIKASADRTASTAAQFGCGALLLIPFLLVAGPPTDSLDLLAISAIVHLVYLIALIRSYNTADFSMAYPLARGGGALLAALGGIAFLDDDYNLLSGLAVGVVALGLLTLVRPDTPPSAVGWGVATGALIGTYTLLDSAGAREAGGISYAAAISLCTGITFNLYAVSTVGAHAVAREFRSRPLEHFFAGACTMGAYLLVLIAVNHAPVGYVATLRESSVVLGAAAGWLLLKEKLGAPRVASSAVVAAGMVMLIAARP